MDDLTITNENTPIDSFKLLGDFWTLRIIDALGDGELRYCNIQRRADGINPVTLCSRLKKLEQAGLIQRQDHAQDKISVSYNLTKLGHEALPVLKAINDFSGKFKPTL
ncbi:MAG TPA: helix-turn-helix domain-containing protein [Candidatus Polarisedimenticolaceae bacterium]|nr:helix-turn-helix domain-containing protein [Candidatus Polarisedimenticolaceae bacterium]